MKNDLPPTPPRLLSDSARIAIVYILIAGLWIVCSDAVVEWLAGSAEAAARFQTYKGLFYVLITAALLYVLIRRATNRLRKEAGERKETEARFRSLVEQTHDAVVCYEFDPPISTHLSEDEQARQILAGRVVECNAAGAASLGLESVEQVLGRRLADLLETAISQSNVDEELRAFLRNGYRLIDFEAALKMPDGSTRHFSDNAHGVIEDGGLVRLWLASRDSTARRQHEEMLAVRLRLADLSTTASTRDLLREFLDEAEKLTGSQIGFFHFVEDDQKTLSLQMWSTNTLEKMCTAEGMDSHYPIDKAGVWVDCVREGKPVIHNDYASLPHRKGMPEGHVPVVRELVVPVSRGGKIRVILGVGNKASDYTENDTRMVQELADLAWDTIERKRAEEALRVSEERLNLAMSVNNDGLYDWNVGEDRLYFDARYYTMAGYEPDAFPASYDEWANRVHPEDFARVDQDVKAYLTGEISKYDLEFRFRRKNGEWMWIRARIQAVERDESGKPIRMVGTHTDITERKLAEEELRRKDYIIQSASSAIATSDLAGNMTYANPTFLEMWGFDDLAELLGKPFTEYWLPGERLDEIMDTLRNRGRWTDETRARRKDGSVFDVQVSAALVHDGEGNPVSLMSSSVDITERKRASEELRSAQAKLEAAVAQSPSGILIADAPDVTIRLANAAALGIRGGDQQLLTAIDVSKHSANWQTFRLDGSPYPTEQLPLSRAVLQGQTIRNEEVIIRDADGADHLVSVNAAPIRDGEGRVTGGIVVFHDISDLKRATEEIQASAARYRALFEAAGDALFTMRVEGDEVLFSDCNPRTLETFGLSRDEMIGKSPWDQVFSPPTQPDGRTSAECAREHANRALQGEPQLFEWVHHKADGSRLDTEVLLNRIPGDAPELHALLRDITDRKRAEERLNESNARFRGIVQNSPVAIALLDPDGYPYLCNPALEQLVGYSADELSRMLFSDFTHPEDADKDMARFRELISEEREGYEMEKRYIHKDGRVVHAHLHVAAIRDDKGDLKWIIGMAEDITERKRVQAAVEESEERLRGLFDRSGYAIGVSRDGTTVMANAAYLELFGCASASELAGRPLLDQIAPEERDRIREIAFRRSKGGPAPDFYETQGLRSDGTVFDMDVRVSTYEQGGDVFTIGIMRDITDRKQAERKLAEAMREITTLKEQIEAENVYLREEIRIAHLHGDIVGRSEAMKSVLAQAEQVAETDSTVLILGETGTGKELLARAIHNMSPLKDKSLVTVNCGAMPAALVESELFGREKGAYTGALSRQIGRFEAANGGTIFLDEVGELPAETQVKLLRVLQEGQFERLGSTDTISVDVRVIAATNRDLEQEAQEGRFRQDLFFRLNVFPITIPPLRERRDDIEPLIWSFVNELSTRMGKRIETISKADLERMQGYSWPGNVRELRNVVERTMITARGPTLRIRPPAVAPSQPSVEDATLDEVQRRHILSILERTNWRIRGQGGAAEILALNPSTLESRMAKLGIKRTQA